MDRIIRAVLEGDEALPGRVPAVDVARLVLGLQSALRRAAHVVLGRPHVGTAGGRYRAAIETATRLRFVAVESGSFAGVLTLPDLTNGQTGLLADLESQDLGFRALQVLLDALAPGAGDVDRSLALAIERMAEDVNVGGRTSAIRLEWLASGQQVQRFARVDIQTRAQMQAITGAAAQARDIVRGRIVEADFERSTARLRQPTGEAVAVGFDEELADEIQAVLRQSRSFTGDVTFDPQTGRVTGVQLRRVSQPSEQAAIEGPDFHRHRTVAELAVDQGVLQIQRLEDLESREVDAAERAAFVAAAENS